ncbi:hypothetical protein LPTSP4_17020 [Leptospira ryugenii]|uniref:Polyketide cyclase/dehydrase and lipid transport n=1 Tax=Leptospira ryugenii TaxID=1917863 RepID=A0A2P2DZW5_9LEPT|nr:polyketide cyclase [Leptospira ryugenii]GBF50178.1 hypothetical protein LPTSP4_17020 [Leptospira ryugenii]
MISKSYSYITKEIGAEEIWKVVSNINKWTEWDKTLKFAKIDGEFKAGNFFTIQPTNGPKVKILLVDVKPSEYFKDLTRFPFAKMYGEHFYEQTKEGLKITITMSISGILSSFWNHIVMKDIVSHLPEDIEAQIIEAKKIKSS